jgi:hypothetical protein
MQEACQVCFCVYVIDFYILCAIRLKHELHSFGAKHQLRAILVQPTHSDTGFAQALFPLRAKQQKNRNSKRSDD